MLFTHCSYVKYTCNCSFYYKEERRAAPPLEMWGEGILVPHSKEARLWYIRRDIIEMCDELSNNSP